MLPIRADQHGRDAETGARETNQFDSRARSWASEKLIVCLIHLPAPRTAESPQTGTTASLKHEMGRGLCKGFGGEREGKEEQALAFGYCTHSGILALEASEPTGTGLLRTRC